MSRIKDAFIDAEGGRKKAFIAYLMAGDPSLEASARYILAVQEAGADLIEVGIPFSDPIAEGEVIQAASVRAIAAGTRLTGVFQMLASIQGKMHIPVVLMTYLNPVFVYGYQRFCTQAAELGIAGLILPDLPFEEQGELRGVANQQGIEVVTMLAPTSASRAACLAEQAQGFVYLVSSLGVTGMRSAIDTDLTGIVAEVRRHTEIPVAIGFGISTPQQAGRFAAIADGVIVGSAIVNIVANGGEAATTALSGYVRQMKASMAPL